MSESPPTNEPRRKAYRASGITVLWEPRLCIHSGHCFRHLPAVFLPGDVPWIHPERADPERITDVVRKCPTGALHFERPDGSAEEPASHGVEVTVMPNGPLYLRGDLEIRRLDGTVVRRDTRVALCRCGRSKNKPYCDDSHLEAGFHAE